MEVPARVVVAEKERRAQLRAQQASVTVRRGWVDSGVRAEATVAPRATAFSFEAAATEPDRPAALMEGLPLLPRAALADFAEAQE